MYKGLFMYMIRHPVQSLFVGTFPMGLATIINMIVFVCVPAWDFWATTLAWTLWWIDAVISVMTCFYLPFVIIHVHESGLSKMTAAWLLPIVSTIVAAVSWPKFFRTLSTLYGPSSSLTFSGIRAFRSLWWS